MTRRVYHVVRKDETWHVRRTQARLASGCHARKATAILHAKSLANRPGLLGQVVVHGRNGKAQTEWTYGDDPRRAQG